MNQESHGEQRMQGNEGVIASENHGSNGENAGLSLHHVSKGRSVEKGEETDNVESAVADVSNASKRSPRIENESYTFADDEHSVPDKNETERKVILKNDTKKEIQKTEKVKIVTEVLNAENKSEVGLVLDLDENKEEKESSPSDQTEADLHAEKEGFHIIFENVSENHGDATEEHKRDYPLTIEEKRRKQLENRMTIEEKRKMQKRIAVSENHKQGILAYVKRCSHMDQLFLLLLSLCECMNVYISLQIFRYTRMLYALMFFLVFTTAIIGGVLLLIKHRKTGMICNTLLSGILIVCSIGCFRVSQFTNTVFHGIESETVMIVARKDSSLEATSDFTDLKIAFVIRDSSSNTFAEIILENENKTNYKKIECQTYQEAYEYLMDHTVDLMVYTMQIRNVLEENDIDSWSHVKVILEGKRDLEAVKSKNVDITKDPFNVLISGVDLSSAGINEKGNSDVNIILSVNPSTKKIIMQTIPRDSWAPLACYDHKHSKLTYAGRNGGIDCSIKTIEEMYGITIHYYAKINFQGVMDLVDAFGGITIYNDIAFCTPYQDRYDNSLDVCFQEGENRIDGAQALIYSRVRKIFSEGDIERGRHQMAVIHGVIREFQKAPTISNINSLLGAVEDNFTTNFDENDLGKALDLLISMQGELTDIEAYTMEGEMLWDTDEITNEYLYYFYPYEGQVELFQKRIQEVMEGK